LPDTVTELSATLLKLLKDNNLREQLGNNGREQVNQVLSLDKMSASLSKIYNSMT
jgi:glycosyltransferase involved in cell wall biosynthesis